MAVTLGPEGYCLAFGMREGKPHCQKGRPDRLRRSLRDARTITGPPLRLQLDSGHDPMEPIDGVVEHNAAWTPREAVDVLIQWNPRPGNPDEGLDDAERHGRWAHPGEGKRVARCRVTRERRWQGCEDTVRRVMRVIERPIQIAARFAQGAGGPSGVRRRAHR